MNSIKRMQQDIRKLQSAKGMKSNLAELEDIVIGQYNPAVTQANLERIRSYIAEHHEAPTWEEIYNEPLTDIRTLLSV